MDDFITPWPVKWVTPDELRAILPAPSDEEIAAVTLDAMIHGTVIYQDGKHVPYKQFYSPSIVHMIEANRTPTGPGNLKLCALMVRSAWSAA